MREIGILDVSGSKMGLEEHKKRNTFDVIQWSISELLSGVCSLPIIGNA